MIVKDLIEILKTYDPESKVFIETVVRGSNYVDISYEKPNINWVKPRTGFNCDISGVVIYPENQ